MGKIGVLAGPNDTIRMFRVFGLTVFGWTVFYCKSIAHFRLFFTWWWNPGFDTSPTPQLILSRRFPAKISFPWKIEESLLLSPDIAFVISILYFQFTALYDTPNIVSSDIGTDFKTGQKQEWNWYKLVSSLTSPYIQPHEKTCNKLLVWIVSIYDHVKW